MPFKKEFSSNKKSNNDPKIITYTLHAKEDKYLFFDEVQHILCKDWKHFGRNLDALNDIVRSGCFVGEEDKPREINIIKSKILPPKIKQIFVDAMEYNPLLKVNFL